MEPREFTEAQRATLPPHVAKVWAKDQQDTYRPLPSVQLLGKEGRSISRWTFTPEERAAIAAGEDLYLEQLTFLERLQPILPTVGLRDFCPADFQPPPTGSVVDTLREGKVEA